MKCVLTVGGCLPPSAVSVQYKAAYNVLQIMRREGVAADSKTVSTIVFGCLKGRMHAQAVEVVLNVSLCASQLHLRAVFCLARLYGLCGSSVAGCKFSLTHC